MFVPAGFQQDRLQSSAGELHPDSASCHSAPSAGLRPQSHCHRVTSDSALGSRACPHSSDFLRAARRTSKEKKRFSLFFFNQVKYDHLPFALAILRSRTAKSCCPSLGRILPPSLRPASPGCRSSRSRPGCSSTSTEGGLLLRLPDPMR